MSARGKAAAASSAAASSAAASSEAVYQKSSSIQAFADINMSSKGQKAREEAADSQMKRIVNISKYILINKYKFDWPSDIINAAKTCIFLNMGPVIDQKAGTFRTHHKGVELYPIAWKKKEQIGECYICRQPVYSEEKAPNNSMEREHVMPIISAIGAEIIPSQDKSEYRSTRFIDWELIIISKNFYRDQLVLGDDHRDKLLYLRQLQTNLKVRTSAEAERIWNNMNNIIKEEAKIVPGSLRIFYEYASSHRCCNQIKRNHEIIGLANPGPQGGYYIMDDNIKRLLDQIWDASSAKEKVKGKGKKRKEREGEEEGATAGCNENPNESEHLNEIIEARVKYPMNKEQWKENCLKLMKEDILDPLVKQLQKSPTDTSPVPHGDFSPLLFAVNVAKSNLDMEQEMQNKWRAQQFKYAEDHIGLRENSQYNYPLNSEILKLFNDDLDRRWISIATNFSLQNNTYSPGFQSQEAWKLYLKKFEHQDNSDVLDFLISHYKPSFGEVIRPAAGALPYKSKKRYTKKKYPKKKYTIKKYTIKKYPKKKYPKKKYTIKKYLKKK